MKRLVFILSCFLLFYPVFAQQETTHWYYGRNVGLSFRNFPPTPLFDGASSSPEAIAVTSHRQSGDLLFYSDGVTVWNRQHQVMPHGKDLLGFQTSTQGALIVPSVTDEQVYYLFTLTCPRYDIYKTPGLYYSLVDMRLDGGKGDVLATTKNIQLLPQVTEKLTAVRHTNGRDYWVITHGYDNDLFYVFLLNDQGISAPQTFQMGTIHNDMTPQLTEAAGYLKASPNGKMLACAVYNELESRPFELYDFDANTGKISNYRSLGSFFDQYGVSFSPDNSKLYLTVNSQRVPATTETLVQFDLSVVLADGTFPSTYLSYPVVIGQNPVAGEENPNQERPIGLTWALQLGLDGKLYTSSPYVINRPNEKAEACQISTLEPQLRDRPNRGFQYGLPNFLQESFANLPAIDGLGENCTIEQVFRIGPNPSAGPVIIEMQERCRNPYGLKVYTVLGQVVYHQMNVTALSHELVLTSLPAGLYLVEIQYNQQRKIYKLVKR
ncbi:hypothetical protein BWI93_08725 [Siphonobacter sp. BAB-5385]|uniref:T9SS type A sorting domain-containing protein n=1 Tax=Siphonobacter sp. BAB-5385 TaxID=1864822 RepID=UPI000B9E3AF8|nr:T9SS type A sorting domain-containing protein [Siphonobacter sp. BAB-5385]OZI08473.1 hypothetical protein BWI93_08725 [Siphonobacter sp. BAB-5385]